MPFELHLTPADQAYLDALPLSPRAKEALKNFMDYAIANIKDEVRTDPEIRPDPSNPFFVMDFFLVDRWGDDCWHRITFTIDDSHAAQGKLLVVFVDHTQGPWDFASRPDFSDLDQSE